MTQTAPPFSEWLRRRRRALDLTQAELARLVGCSVVLVTKLESGERRPSKQIAALLAERLEIPPAEREAFIQFARGLSAPPPAAPAGPPDLPPLAVAPAAPAARSAPPPPPAPPLLGREAELARLGELLASPASRLISIVGPGGVGKTSLALELVRRAEPGRAFFVALAPVESPDMVAQAVAAGLGLASAGAGTPAVAAIAAELRGRGALLVLDNLEHLLADEQAAADPVVALVVELLRLAPDLQIVATSRERLSVSDEWVVDLSGLPAGADAGPAVELFVAAARRLRTGYAPGAEERAAIGALCQAVGGLPLAIELAASWADTLGPAELLAELGHSADVLSTHARDVPARHRSMRVVFDQSWAMLREAERAALARLALFRGPFTREAAAYVARADLQMVAALQQKSLLRRAAGARYDLHPLVRRFSRERLGRLPEADEAARRYVDYYLALAAQGHEEIGGAGQRDWLDLLDREHDNLRGALDMAWRQGMAERGSRLGVALLRFWKLRGHYREGLLWAERLLELGGASPGVRAQLLEGASRFAGALDDWQRALALAEQALGLRRADPDQASLAHGLLALGEAEHDALQFERARAHFEEALALFAQLDDAPGRSAARNGLATLRYDTGDAAGARRILSESVAIDEARGDANAVAISLTNLGLIAALDGDQPAAARDLGRALATFRELGNRAGVIFVLTGLAALAGGRGRWPDAARLLGAADALRAELQFPISPANRPHFARLDELARGAATPAEFAAARAAARQPLDEAVALAAALAQELQ